MSNGIGAVVDLPVTNDILIETDQRMVGILADTGQEHLRDAFELDFSPLQGG